MTTLETAVETAKNYYKTHNLDVPSNVVEYIKSFAPGLSRQMLKSKFNITCSEFVKLLTPTYTKVLNASERALTECTRLGYILITDPKTLHNSRNTVVVLCKECGYEHSTTITSLQGTKLGCPKCKSGNLPWHRRKEELVNLLITEFNAELVSDIPASQTGYITIKHLNCGNEYTTQLLGVVSPNSTLRGTCPNCRSSDRRVTINGITFGSSFEAECYNILKPFNPEIHIPYSKYINTNRRWVCDFKVGNVWIEVSNFKQDYKGYFANIEDKRTLVESTGDFIFLFIRSIEDLKSVVELL